MHLRLFNEAIDNLYSAANGRQIKQKILNTKPKKKSIT